MSWKSSDEFGFKTCEGAVTQLFHPPAGVAPADYLRVSLRTDGVLHPWGICMNCSAACEAHRGDPAFCPVCHCRRTALSTDGGFTWANFTDQGAVPDPKSRGGLTRWPERKALVLANCANHHITHHSRTNGERDRLPVRLLIGLCCSHRAVLQSRCGSPWTTVSSNVKVGSLLRL